MTSIRPLPGTFDYLPEKLAETDVEALVIDTIHAFLELVPMSLGMPYAHVWNILHIDFSGATPPCFFSWPHESTPQAVARNLEGVKVASEIFGAGRTICVCRTPRKWVTDRLE